MTIILTQVGMITENGINVDYYEVPEFGSCVNTVTLEVLNEPPRNLECPEFWENEARLHRIFLIDSDTTDYAKWSGYRVHWNDKDWILTSIVSVANKLENKNRFYIELETVEYRKLKMCYNELCK